MKLEMITDVGILDSHTIQYDTAALRVPAVPLKVILGLVIALKDGKPSQP